MNCIKNPACMTALRIGGFAAAGYVSGVIAGAIIGVSKNAFGCVGAISSAASIALMTLITFIGIKHKLKPYTISLLNTISSALLSTAMIITLVSLKLLGPISLPVFITLAALSTTAQLIQTGMLYAREPKMRKALA